MPTRVAFLTAAAIALAVPAAAQETAGAELYGQCLACHQIGEGAGNAVGPQLNDLLGRAAGGLEGYLYSSGMTAAGGDGLVWTEETLDAFLADPMAVVPGTSMGYPGMEDAADRAHLIGYLQTFGGAGDMPTSAGFVVAPEILALEGDPAYGEYLSGDCTACHASAASADGIPSIKGRTREAFVTLMQAYKQGAIAHPVMTMMASRLSDEEIASLAAYFESAD